MKPLPLSRLRVLDIASFYAAPFTATLLADFGAEVIKIEPLEGDGMRGSGFWTLLGRNKKSVTLDLRKPEGCAVLKDLVAKSDILIDNYPANVLAKRGIGWAELSKVNPKLIMASVSLFGQQGPYTDLPGNGTTSEAFGGLTHLTGEADGPPVLPSLPFGDAIGAMSTALGIVTAAYWRDMSGGTGQHIDASLYEPILVGISQAVSRWKPGQAPRRTGSRVPGLPVRNVYATADGHYVAISTTTRRHTDEIVMLAGGLSDACPEPDAAVAAWIRKLTLKQTVDALVKQRIPVAPVNDLEQLLADPHVQARNSLLTFKDPELGDVAVTNPAPRLSQSPGSIRTINPKLGEHNDEVFGSLLGYSADRIASMRGGKVI